MAFYRNHPVMYAMDAATGMDNIPDASVDLLIGGSVYLGKGVPWANYRKLYRTTYMRHGLRVLKPGGYFLVIQTNMYAGGQVFNRYGRLAAMLRDEWRMVDEKVWQRKRADMFQVPFSHVFVYRHPDAPDTGRKRLWRHEGYRLGVWDYPMRGKRGAKNGWPVDMCKMITEAFTNEDDTICDIFAGTGTMLHVAGLHHRQAFGFDIDPEMHEFARKTNDVKILDDFA